MTTDPLFGTVDAGDIRACTYGKMTQNGWAYSFGGHLGSNPGEDADVRFACYLTDSGSPDVRMSYSNQANAHVSMDSGSTGDTVSASVLNVGSAYGVSNKGFMLSSGQEYAIAMIAITDELIHGMCGTADATGDYKNFYDISGAGGTVPPTTYNETSTSVQGWATLWLDYDANVSPEKPVVLTPTGTTTDTAPIFTADFKDKNGAYGTSSGLGADRGDFMKQYAIQVRVKGTTTPLLWDITANASNTEQSANKFTRTYGGSTLSTGVIYQSRCKVSDRFGTWSTWSDWTDFTPSAAGYVTLDGTPSGKQEAITGLTFQGRWTHPTSLAADKVKIQLLQGGSIIGTSGEISVSVSSSASPGTLFGIAQSSSSIFNNINWGQSYEYQMKARASNGVWSDYSLPRSFNVNYKPNTPIGLSPSGGVSSGDRPLLSCTMTDPDDTSGTGLTCYAVLRSIPNMPNKHFNDGVNNWTLQNKHANVTVTGSAIAYDALDYSGQGGSGKAVITASTLATSNIAYELLHTTYIPVEMVGENVSFQIAVRTTAANLRPRRFIEWYNASHVLLSTNVEADPVLGADTWSSATYTATVPASTKFFRVGVRVYTAAGNVTGTVYIDDLVNFDVTHRKPTMTQVSGSTTLWEYQTTSDELFIYGTYYFSAYGYDGSVNGDVSPSETFSYTVGPVVTVTSPTAAQVIPTSTPTYTWTATDQQRFRVIVYTNDSNPTTVKYDSGEIVSTVSSHVQPSGYLIDGDLVKVVVKVWDSVNADGQSSQRAFSIVYDPIDPVTNFVWSGSYLQFDKVPSAILLSWDETLFPPSQFEHYTIYRREGAQSESERIILKRITSQSQRTFLDGNPRSGTEYIYEVTQTIRNGSDVIESAPVQLAASITLPYTIITAADDPDSFRCVIRYFSERRFNENTDGKEILTWGSTKPSVVFGSVYYKNFNIVARFVDDNIATKQDYVDAVSALLQRRGITCYRDPKGRRLFGVMKQSEQSDLALATLFEVGLEFTEVNYSEGVE